jgi:hypothetical protein
MNTQNQNETPVVIESDILTLANSRVSGKIESLKAKLDTNGVADAVANVRELRKIGKAVSAIATSSVYTETERAEIQSRFSAAVSEIF